MQRSFRYNERHLKIQRDSVLYRSLSQGFLPPSFRSCCIRPFRIGQSFPPEIVLSFSFPIHKYRKISCFEGITLGRTLKSLAKRCKNLSFSIPLPIFVAFRRKIDLINSGRRTGGSLQVGALSSYARDAISRKRPELCPGIPQRRSRSFDPRG